MQTGQSLPAKPEFVVRAQTAGNFHYLLIGGAIIIYALAMVVVLAVV